MRFADNAHLFDALRALVEGWWRLELLWPPSGSCKPSGASTRRYPSWRRSALSIQDGLAARLRGRGHRGKREHDGNFKRTEDRSSLGADLNAETGNGPTMMVASSFDATAGPMPRELYAAMTSSGSLNTLRSYVLSTERLRALESSGDVKNLHKELRINDTLRKALCLELPK